MKRICMAALAAFFVFSLWGCAGSDTTALTACRAYAATLSSLADARARGQLSPGQVEEVNRYRPRANALCTQGGVPQTDLVVAEGLHAIAALIRVEQEASQ